MSRDFEITFFVEDPSGKNEDGVEYTADISVTSWGNTGSWNDPPEAPEWEIDKIWDDQGDEIPYYLPPRWRDRFEAWFNSKPIKKRVNPEWEKISLVIEKFMEDQFDWSDAQSAAAEDYYDYRNET